MLHVLVLGMLCIVFNFFRCKDQVYGWVADLIYSAGSIHLRVQLVEIFVVVTGVNVDFVF